MAYLRHWSVSYLVPSAEMRVGVSSEHKHNTPPCVVSKRWWVGRSFADLGAESIGGRQRLLPTSIVVGSLKAVVSTVRW
jgi:hypothetical protein